MRVRRHASLLGAALAGLALHGCVPPPRPAPAPAPAPAPPPVPAPAPTPTPLPFTGHWMDAPATAGDWSYQPGLAAFGVQGAQPLLMLRCDRAGGTIEISRSGAAGAPAAMRVLTEFMDRSLDAAPAVGDPATLVARVPSRDPLLDAAAFSKGRFAVEVTGLATIYIPSFPEVTRVIEDCR